MPEPSFHCYIPYFLISNAPFFSSSSSPIFLTLVTAWIILIPTFSQILLPSTPGHNKVCWIPTILCHLLSELWLSACLGRGSRYKYQESEGKLASPPWCEPLLLHGRTHGCLSASIPTHLDTSWKVHCDTNSVLISASEDNTTKTINKMWSTSPSNLYQRVSDWWPEGWWEE